MTKKAIAIKLLQGGLFIYPAFFILMACPRAILPQAKAPTDEGPHGPSLTQLEGTSNNALLHSEVKRCESCHQTQTQDWKASIHAFSSFNNPFYRFNFDNFVRDKGLDKGVFCAGCHDPALLQSGEILQEIKPQSKSAHAGINCIACHRMENASHDGNGSYTLVTDSLLLPQDGESQSLARHQNQMKSAQRLGNRLCVSCHRGFLSPVTGHDLFIPALEDWKPFRHSGYNQQKATRVDVSTKDTQCISCHMPLKTDAKGKTIHDHGFMGGHTAFTTIASQIEQQKKQQKLLKSSAKLFVPLAGFDNEKGRLLDKALSWQEAKSIYFDVVIWNHNTGHAFPGGAKDIKDTWIEVQIFDEDGTLVVENGKTHEQDADDVEAHRLGVLQINEQGKPVSSHQVAHFRTAAFDHTIGPRDARVIRYALDLKQFPQLKSKQLKAKVKLRHRRLMPSFFNASCNAAQSQRGQDFIQGTKSYNATDIKPCATQPILDLQTKEFTWIADGKHLNQGPSTQALWGHGLGMLHALNEKVFLARHSFNLAEKISKKARIAQDWKARLRWAQATVSRLQGKAAEAITLYQEALQSNKNHPALLYGIAQTYMKTWRFKEAIPFLKNALQQTPEDIRLAIALARSYASLKQYKESLRVTHKALDIEPRDAHLLRLQTIAIEKQYPKSDIAKQARQIFLKYKRDELAPAIQGKCQDNSAFCKRERLGFHTHQLQPANTPSKE